MAAKTTNKKVKFDFILKDLADQDIIDQSGPVNAGKLLASVLANMNTGDAFKLIEWARKMYRGEEIEFNPSERKTLEDFITETKSITNLAKEQLLSMLLN